MEKIGIIDLGSNTARLVIANMFADGHYMVVDELKESVRLGQDMDRDGFLKPQRIAETIKTLKMFKRLCDASGVERIIAVGTAAVRRAKNQRSFLDEIQVACNITIRVLSEEEEAIFKRGRNIGHTKTPKNATVAEYRSATGMEVLFGYLFATGNEERLAELFEIGYKESLQ